MSFAKAFERAIAKKEEDSGMTLPPRQNDGDENWEPIDPEDVPMMYRAQVQGRCSLQYGKAQQDLDQWTEEWVYPNRDNKDQPFYQHSEPQLGLDGLVYRFKIKFPFRVFTNCGQDSILRPTIGTNGIPFIPGSGIKGLFERLSRHPQLSAEQKQIVREYCGTPEEQGSLRFHGAYPIGDWAGTKKVKLENQPEKTCYRMIDVVHPQQKRQVEHTGGPQAIAVVSFYQPTFIFELSSIEPLPEEQWKNIEGLLRRALRPGLGGKTSTGYGLCFIPQDNYPLWVYLEGKGVSPLLRSGEPEFRPNLFKASLKGHVKRLLGGASNREREIANRVNKLFGHTTEPGDLQLYWESQSGFPKPDTFGDEKTPIYKTEGLLYLDLKNSSQEDLAFLQKVLEFTLIMGGLGKSWRRVWHGDFFQKYRTRAIGCHWKCLDSKVERTEINNTKDLKGFLTKLYEQTKQYLRMSPKSEKCLPWMEAWCPQRLSVYSQVVSLSEASKTSKAIHLFHDSDFKTTPAIGGRKPGDDHPTSFSLVWHRMLPIEGNKYLEIVTLFHGGKSGREWLHQWEREQSKGRRENQLPLFVKALEGSGFEFTWGTKPPQL